MPDSFAGPLDCSPTGSSVHGILQARTLEWVAIPFSRGLPNPGIKPLSPAFQADSSLLSGATYIFFFLQVKQTITYK